MDCEICTEPMALDDLSKNSIDIKSIESVIEKNNIVRVPATLKSYWDGKYSRCLANNAIEQYINDSINKQKINISAIFSSSDGLLSHSEYDRQYKSIGRNIANISEKVYFNIKSNKLINTIPAVGILCTRDFDDPNLLLLPLDDDTFRIGLHKTLSNISFPEWEKRKNIVFWRGGASGYDRPSLRMKITNILYENKLADVRITEWGKWEVGCSIPKKHFGDRCGLDKHVTYKYILIIDGNCIASSHQWVFGSGSVPIMITHPSNNYWFKKYLKPMINYVPIEYDLSDLEDKIKWLVDNDDKAKEIATNALKLSNEIFTPEFQRNYIDTELLRISSVYKA